MLDVEEQIKMIKENTIKRVKEAEEELTVAKNKIKHYTKILGEYYTVLSFKNELKVFDSQNNQDKKFLAKRMNFVKYLEKKYKIDYNEQYFTDITAEVTEYYSTLIYRWQVRILEIKKQMFSISKLGKKYRGFSEYIINKGDKDIGAINETVILKNTLDDNVGIYDDDNQFITEVSAGYNFYCGCFKNEYLTDKYEMGFAFDQEEKEQEHEHKRYKVDLCSKRIILDVNDNLALKNDSKNNTVVYDTITEEIICKVLDGFEVTIGLLPYTQEVNDTCNKRTYTL